MDIEEYWQENKTFVTRVGLGALGFLIGLGVVSRTVGRDLDNARTQQATMLRKLKSLQDEAFPTEALDLAEEDHRQLESAALALRGRVQFEPRAQFRDAAATATPASYLSTVTEVRERIFPEAVRSNVEIEPGLGLPELSPTRAEELERTLEGLDALEQVLEIAIEERVGEIDKLKIRIDPDLFGRHGVGVLERTRVDLRMRGDNGPILRTLARTQAVAGRALMIEKLEMSASRERPDEVRLECTFVVGRVAEQLGLSDSGGQG